MTHCESRTPFLKKHADAQVLDHGAIVCLASGNPAVNGGTTEGLSVGLDERVGLPWDINTH